MNHLHVLACAVAVTFATGSAAYAGSPLPDSNDSLAVYSQAKDWTVYVDASHGNCLAERSDDAGNAMQMGQTKDHSAAYVGVFTKAETGFSGSQPIEIAVDGTVFVGESHALRSGQLAGGYSGGYVVTDNPNFVNAIAEGRELVAFPGLEGTFVVDLTGTKVAIEEIEKCNKLQAD